MFWRDIDYLEADRAGGFWRGLNLERLDVEFPSVGPFLGRQPPCARRSEAGLPLLVDLPPIICPAIPVSSVALLPVALPPITLSPVVVSPVVQSAIVGITLLGHLHCSPLIRSHAAQ